MNFPTVGLVNDYLGLFYIAPKFKKVLVSNQNVFYRVGCLVAYCCLFIHPSSNVQQAVVSTLLSNVDCHTTGFNK